LIKKEKTEAVMREKDTLKMLIDRPFIIKLIMTFMDKEYLYFVFEHCKYGTLSSLISIEG
jgi:serine/threonine protein kinase